MAWYEEGNPLVAKVFIARVTAAFDALCSWPRMHPLWKGKAGRQGVRKWIVWQFPYLVPYWPDEAVALVLAVAHQRRRPAYWLPRLLGVLKAPEGQRLAGQVASASEARMAVELQALARIRASLAARRLQGREPDPAPGQTHGG